MDDPFAPLPTPTDPVPAVPPAFAGQRPSRASAVRAGMILGTALVVVVGAAVAMGASTRPSTSGAGPMAAASGSPAPEKGPKGNGFGHGGFGPSFGGFGPFGGGEKPGKATGHGFGHVTISAIDGSKVSLATDDGWTRTITLTASTTITRGGAAATAADLHVGDTVRFRQQRETDGSFTITAVDIVLPQVVGTIQSVSGDTVTLLGRDGATVTVHLGATTVIRVRGVEKATAKDLAAGLVAIVVGEKRADGSIDATGVAAGKLREPKIDKPRGDRPGGSAAPGASVQPG